MAIFISCIALFKRKIVTFAFIILLALQTSDVDSSLFSRCSSIPTSISVKSTFRSKLIQGTSPHDFLWCQPSVTRKPTFCMVPTYRLLKTSPSRFLLFGAYLLPPVNSPSCLFLCGAHLLCPKNLPSVMVPYLCSLPIVSWKFTLLWGAHLLSAENSTRLLPFCKTPTYFLLKTPPRRFLEWCPPIVTWKLRPPPLLLQGCESQLGGGVLHPQARCGRGNLQLRPSVLICLFSGSVMTATKWQKKWLNLVKNLGNAIKK